MHNHFRYCCNSQCKKGSEILSPNTIHHIEMDKDGFGLTINIRKSTFQDTFQTLLNEHNLLSDFFSHTFYDAETSNYITFDIENTPEFNYLIQQIFDESNCAENHSNMICVSLLNLFFGKLLQDFGRTIHLYSDVNNATYNRSFPLMLKYVQSNYQTITLPMMSQIFHYNESYISLLFKKYLNENFSNVVQNLRLEQSKNLLENTEWSHQNIEKNAKQPAGNSAGCLAISTLFEKILSHPIITALFLSHIHVLSSSYHS